MLFEKIVHQQNKKLSALDGLGSIPNGTRSGRKKGQLINLLTANYKKRPPYTQKIV